MKQKNNILTDQRIVALLAFISCALWGSAFSTVKTGYTLLGIRSDAWADQLTFGGIRFAVAGVMALGFGSMRAKKPLLPNRRTFPKICLISLFQTVLQYFCYYIGLANTSGVRASVLVGMNVFTAILISSLLLRIEKLTVHSILGCTVGFLGLVLINLDGLQGSFHFLGDGMILLCTVASGFSSAFMKKLSVGEDPVLLSGWQFLLGGLVLAGIGLLGGGTPGHFSGPAFLLLLYLAFISAAAYSLWALLLKYNPVSRVAVYGFMNPICGVIISAVVLGEFGQITLRFVTALLLVCVGIVIVNLTGRHSAQRHSVT